MRAAVFRSLVFTCLATHLPAATLTISKDVSFSAGSTKVFWPVPAGSGISEVIAARDGGRIVIGAPDSFDRTPSISKLSSDGEPAWTQSLGETNLWHFYVDSIETTNRDVVVLEYTSSSLPGSSLFGNPRLQVLNREGNLVKKVEIASPLLFQKLVQVGNGYLMAGKYPLQFPNPANWRIIIRRLTHNFETEWERLTPTGDINGRGPEGNGQMGVIDLKATRDRGAIYLLDSGYVVKVTPDGTNEWKTGLGSGDTHLPQQVLPLREGGYLVAYSSSLASAPWRTAPLYGQSDIWLVRLNEEGQKIWDRSFGGNQRDAFSFITQTDDGGFMLGGYSESDTISGNKGVSGRGTWLLKLNSGGVKEAEYLIGGEYWKLLPKSRGFEAVGWSDATPCCSSLSSVDINARLRVNVTARSSGDRPFKLDVSTNLTTWAPRVMGFLGELRLLENPNEPQKFYRVRDAGE